METVIQNSKNGKMLDKTLIEYLKEKGAKTATKMNGPKGAFISWTNANDVRMTIPIGHNSQLGKLNEFNLIEVEGGVVIATVNSYKEEETVSFN